MRVPLLFPPHTLKEARMLRSLTFAVALLIGLVFWAEVIAMVVR